jgi:hypothetical protein
MSTRDLAAVRSGFGLAQLAGPWPGAGESAGRRLTQVLGVRHLVQAGVSGPEPTTAVLALGVEADLLHALTMVVVAMAQRSARRPALAQAAVAVGFAAAGAIATRHAAHQPVRVKDGRLSFLRRSDEVAQNLAPRLIPERLMKALTD